MSKEKETAEATTEAKSPFWYIEGTPMAIHANMQTGQFLPFGDEEQAVKKMTINIFGWRFFNCKMFVKESDTAKEITKLLDKGFAPETAKLEADKINSKDWAEIFFVKDFNPNVLNPVCSMLLKTYSLQNFMNEAKKFFYQTLEDGKTPCKMSDVVFELTTNKKEKEGKTFYEILFKGKLAGRDVINQITDFLSTNPLIYDQTNITENLRNSHTYRLMPNQSVWQVPENFEGRNLLIGIEKQKTIETKEIVLNEQN